MIQWAGEFTFLIRWMLSLGMPNSPSFLNLIASGRNSFFIAHNSIKVGIQVVLFHYATNVLSYNVDFWGCWKNFAGQGSSGRMSGPLVF